MIQPESQPEIQPMFGAKSTKMSGREVVVAMTRRPGFALALCVGFMSIASCAKSPTVVSTYVTADGTVPPLLVVRTTVAAVADPTRQATSSFVSLTKGDAADRPAPFQFPMTVPVSVPGALAGPVTITIEGLDYDTAQIVLARGTTAGEAVIEKETKAALTLTAVPVAGGGDGGADGGSDGGDDDGGASGDAASAAL